MKNILHAIWTVLEAIGQARAQTRIKFGHY